MELIQLIGGLSFHLLSAIDPVRGPDARPLEFMPQARYANRRNLRLNPHGRGSFCKISLDRLPSREGVYAITVDHAPVYVGECVDLRERFGPRGYGDIAPRNCFVGGQPTNCKVNHRILVAAKEARQVQLWFLETPQRKAAEAQLRHSLTPAWNAL